MFLSQEGKRKVLGDGGSLRSMKNAWLGSLRDREESNALEKKGFRG